MRLRDHSELKERDKYSCEVMNPHKFRRHIITGKCAVCNGTKDMRWHRREQRESWEQQNSKLTQKSQ